MPRTPVLLLAVGLMIALGAVAAAGPRRSLAPLPPAQAASSHGPYVSRECGACHARNDARNPGAVTRQGNALCLDCHDDFKGERRASRHPATRAACTGCHNPHNGRARSLLH
jgi:predicted CXXCH cytochrome family protein